MAGKKPTTRELCRSKPPRLATLPVVLQLGQILTSSEAPELAGAWRGISQCEGRCLPAPVLIARSHRTAR